MKKLHVWQYSFRGTNSWNEGWAEVMLRADGFFAATSDFGNYAHYWPLKHTGHADIREFFLRIDWDYVARKLKPERHVNSEKSFKRVREHIIEMRRSGFYTREGARAKWDYAARFHESDWTEFMYDSETQEHFTEPWELAVQELDSQIVRFAKEVVCARLRDAIQAELESERGLTVLRA